MHYYLIFVFFTLIKNKRTALLVSLGVLLTFTAVFSVLFFFALSSRNLFPSSVNVKHLKTLQADGILNCTIDDTTFQKAENSNLTEYAGHQNTFDGGSTPTTISRTLELDGVDPNNALSNFSTCAKGNGWEMNLESIGAFGDSEQRGTKTFPDGWSASLYVKVNLHRTDYRGEPADSPYVSLLIQTDFVP